MTTTETSTATTGAVSEMPPVISLHHSALRCMDAEQTRHFYGDIAGLRLGAACIFDDLGDGTKIDYMHLFMRMADGNFAAFFDVPVMLDPDLYKPFGELDMRSGFEVRTEAEFEALQKRLADNGIEFTGPVDHGFMQSIYCKDPSGLRVEFILKNPRYDEILKEEKSKAHSNLAAWSAKVAAAN